MKTLLALAITLLAISSGGFAQNLIAVEKGSNVKFYTAIDTAIVHASDGDTLYIPGGNFDVSGITITKQLYIFGVGYNPDSTKATNTSFLSGELTIAPGSKGGLLTGCALCKVNLGTTSNYTFTRCNIGTIIFTKAGSTSSQASNNYFIENVVGKVDGGEAKNNIFLNNFIGILSNFSSGNTFNHNIISGSYSNCSGSGNTENVADNITGSTFENNIFMGWNFSANNSNLLNNLFINFGGGMSSLPSGDISSHNYHIQYPGDTFINYTGGNYISNYNYSDNYHLKSNSPGKNGATDGSDVGIYGGQFSWKDGGIPINPHIQKSIISETTDSHGNLKVNIRVEAQSH